MIYILNMECVFCRIISGEEPAYILHRDEWTISFLDINPVNRGHCLVVPREHYEFFNQLPAHLAQPLIASLAFISSALTEALGADGYNIFLNNGAVAGQVIPHAHFHVLPRYHDDRIRFKAFHQKIDGREMEKIRRKVVEYIGSAKE